MSDGGRVVSDGGRVVSERVGCSPQRQQYSTVGKLETGTKTSYVSELCALPQLVFSGCWLINAYCC